MTPLKLAENNDFKKLKVSTNKLIIEELIFNKNVGNYQSTLEINNHETIATLLDCLKITPSNDSYRLRMYGKLRFVFFNEDKELATIEYLEFDHIRWESYWDNDAMLSNLSLLDFLNDIGVHKPLNNHKKHNEIHTLEEINFNKILNTTPSSLLSETFNKKEIYKSLEREIPNQNNRVKKLFEILGVSITHWSDFTVIEAKAEGILLDLPLNILLEAIDLKAMDSTTLDGVARFFSGNDFHIKRKFDLEKIPGHIKEFIHKRKIANKKSS